MNTEPNFRYFRYSIVGISVFRCSKYRCRYRCRYLKISDIGSVFRYTDPPLGQTVINHMTKTNQRFILLNGFYYFFFTYPMSYVRIKLTASFTLNLRMSRTLIYLLTESLLTCRNLAILFPYLTHFLLSELRKYKQIGNLRVVVFYYFNN